MGLSACRSCATPSPEVVLSLGDMPLANSLPSPTQLAEPDPRFPLEIVLCKNCSLLQLSQTVPPQEMFSEYAYFSSHSEPIVAHAKELVTKLISDRSLDESSFVVELASNDGYLLQHYIDSGIDVLGIDPAENVAELARQRGVPTLSKFFTTQLAGEIREDERPADVIHANNVLAHVPDINDFVGGMARLLADDGVVVIETPYAGDLVSKLEFDTIYHEHVFYYSLTAIEALFGRHGLSVIRLEHIPIHGGSLRVYAAKQGDADGNVVRIREQERTTGLNDISYYADFDARVRTLISEIREFLNARRDQGRTLAGYGAAAKATIMLNALEIGPETIEFVVDSTPYKQGRFIPGVRIPVTSPDTLLERKPDDVVIFAWNFAREIVAKESGFRDLGGTFMVPLPRPQVVSS